MTDEEKELAAAVAMCIPLPGTGDVVVAARVLQLAGMCLCLAAGVRLDRCPCVVDVVEREGRHVIRDVLVNGKTDWHGLADVEPALGTLAGVAFAASGLRGDRKPVVGERANVTQHRVRSRIEPVGEPFVGACGLQAQP
ncbi:MAG TPA: hypothetical protein H9881_16245 [Candidatus Stackebrandtia excrementipullorum]|nr:hypothetical protein [Candidatus Stackebrandtia excrementipullorum]